MNVSLITRNLCKMRSLKISLYVSWAIACYSAIVSASQLSPTDVLVPATTTVTSTWSATSFLTSTVSAKDTDTVYTVVIYGPSVSSTTTTSSYTGTSTSYDTIAENPTGVTVIEYDPIPRTTVTRGWYYGTTETTVFNCGDIEDTGASAMPIRKRDNPYTQNCDPMNTVTTMITEVVHVPIVTSTIQVPYPGETTSTLYSWEDGAVTETDFVYVPNAVCGTSGAACGTSGAEAVVNVVFDAVFDPVVGSQTACCQIGLRCATESADIVCVPATSELTYYWTSTETLTTTYTTYINGLPSVVVEVGQPIVTQTVTTSGDVDYTATLTTITGNSTVGTATVIVEVPYSKEYYNSTFVTDWTGTFTSTYATSTTTIKGSNGVDTVSTIYYVETPQAHGVSTTYSPWSGTFISTYATATSTVKGSDGIDTVSTIYYVETPQVNGVSTIYTPWNGPFTSTYATATTTVKGSDGIDTVSTIYYVETPQSRGVSTIYSPWSGTVTSTYATAMTTVQGANGLDTVNTIYYVQTPNSGYYGNLTAASLAPITQSSGSTSTQSTSVTDASRSSTPESGSTSIQATSVTEASRSSAPVSQLTQQITSSVSRNSASSFASNDASSGPSSTSNKPSSTLSDKPSGFASGQPIVSSAESVKSSSHVSRSNDYSESTISFSTNRTPSNVSSTESVKSSSAVSRSNDYSGGTISFSTNRTPSNSGEPATPVSVLSSATSNKGISRSVVTTIDSDTVTSYPTTCAVTDSQTQVGLQTSNQVTQLVVTTTVSGVVTSYITTCPIGGYHKETLSEVIQTQTPAATLVPGNHTTSQGSASGADTSIAQSTGARAPPKLPTGSGEHAQNSSARQSPSNIAASSGSFNNAATSTVPAETGSAATQSLRATSNGEVSGAPAATGSGANISQVPAVVSPTVLSGSNGSGQTTGAMPSASISPVHVSTTSDIHLSTYAGSAAKLRAAFMLLLPLAVV
ncbi:hypothetical protein HG536_0H04900 [Torulaspora globosa]|uniref:Uncharacterized protein n=1 Tax=Torulaspora globosa TaxID=48254 RepID=A0A7G3ZNM8_9SACH|nr:uncharacterized protein HG536_0H04900 [Torulaspora globosa]QLL35114.1 hypothetical protein HG536_0H04900 [Torulaspora globosa]